MISTSQPDAPLLLEDLHREPFAALMRAFHYRRHHQTREHLRRTRRLLELGFGGALERRRLEDRVRLEWHDAHDITIKAGERIALDTPGA
jgi:hypothetical protein